MTNYWGFLEAGSGGHGGDSGGLGEMQMCKHADVQEGGGERHLGEGDRNKDGGRRREERG